MRGLYQSEHQQSYGEDPNKIVPIQAVKLPPNLKEQTEGTTKRTTHLPGYTGFIPKCDINESASKQAVLESPRVYERTNILQNYHTRLPGYAGHSPMTAKNVKGVTRPLCLGTEGEKY